MIRTFVLGSLILLSFSESISASGATWIGSDQKFGEEWRSSLTSIELSRLEEVKKIDREFVIGIELVGEEYCISSYFAERSGKTNVLIGDHCIPKNQFEKVAQDVSYHAVERLRDTRAAAAIRAIIAGEMSRNAPKLLRIFSAALARHPTLNLIAAPLAGWSAGARYDEHMREARVSPDGYFIEGEYARILNGVISNAYRIDTFVAQRTLLNKLIELFFPEIVEKRKHPIT